MKINGPFGLQGHSAACPLDEQVVEEITRLEGQGKTTMAVCCDGAFLGVLVLADGPRPGVKHTHAGC